MFLFHQNQTVQDFLTENPDLGLQTAYNKKGEVVGEAIAVKNCQLWDLYFKNSIIAITKALPKFTTEGCIGIKFFENTVTVFDFDKSVFCLRKEGADN